MFLLTPQMQLILAAAMTFVTLMLTGRKLKQQNDFSPVTTGTFRLVWEFVVGLWLLSISCWMAIERTGIVHTIGGIIGFIGCIALMTAWFKMNRPAKVDEKPRVSQSMRISEIKQAKKK